MARLDIETLRTGYEAFNRGDWDEFDGGDQIVVYVRVRLRPKGSSAMVGNLIGHLWTMRDGKALRMKIFPEREKALEAAGVSAQSPGGFSE